MQQVHTVDMVAHLWANQSQPSARTARNSMSFDGPVLYSYGTPIAHLVDGVALITSGKYSVTTAAHCTAASAAARHLPAFRVPALLTFRPGYSLGRYTEPQGGHAGNLMHLIGVFDAHVLRLKRGRGVGLLLGYEHETLLAARGAASEYAERFDCGEALQALDARSSAAAAKEIEAAWAARNTPEALAKREAARAKREARAAEIAADRVSAWRRGVVHSLPYDAQEAPCGGAMLRIRGDRLETSKGAHVPLADAIRVFRVVQTVRAKGEAHSFSGLGVGMFQVNHVFPDGSFKAGCHLIRWPEIEQAARAAGVLTEGAA